MNERPLSVDAVNDLMESKKEVLKENIDMIVNTPKLKNDLQVERWKKEVADNGYWFTHTDDKTLYYAHGGMPVLIEQEGVVVPLSIELKDALDDSSVRTDSAKRLVALNGVVEKAIKSRDKEQLRQLLPAINGGDTALGKYKDQVDSILSEDN